MWDGPNRKQERALHEPYLSGQAVHTRNFIEHDAPIHGLCLQNNTRLAEGPVCMPHGSQVAHMHYETRGTLAGVKV